MPDGLWHNIAEESLENNYNSGPSQGAREAIAAHFAWTLAQRLKVPPERKERMISVSNFQTYPAIQGENDQGGGYTMWAGTFTQNSTMRDTIRVTFHADKVNYPAFYYMVTDDPLVAVLAQVPATVEWSVNVGQFLMEAPQLPADFDRQGKIFERKFNLFNQWLQNTFVPQSETKIMYLQQVVIDAPYVPGDLMDTATINIPGVDLSQGEIKNFGDGGRLFNGPQN